jgi:hypothetical protein
MKAENYIVSMTAYEIALIVLILVGVTGIGGAGGGFYFGASLSKAQVVDHSSEVLKLCNKVVDHEDDRVTAWKASNAACADEVNRYRTWLIDVEESTKMRATVARPKKSGRGGIAPPSP